MFEHLAKHTKIIVTGPHRSGTTFAATAIAEDTGHGLILEELCNFSKRNLDVWMGTETGPLVIQAPFMADICHQYPQALVVFMMRNIDDIEASQKRMFDAKGNDVFWPRMEMTVRASYNNDDYGRPVALLKYENWQEQKQRLPHHLELEVESLQKHPLWIPPQKRKNFHVRQTHVVG